MNMSKEELVAIILRKDETERRLQNERKNLLRNLKETLQSQERLTDNI